MSSLLKNTVVTSIFLDDMQDWCGQSIPKITESRQY